jgi:hypothetical protein
MIAYRIHGHGPVKALALHGLFGGGQSFAPMLAGIGPDKWSLAMPDLRPDVSSNQAIATLPASWGGRPIRAKTYVSVLHAILRAGGTSARVILVPQWCAGP